MQKDVTKRNHHFLQIYLSKQNVGLDKLGVHFRRQQVIQGFIGDFYCHKAGLVIEVDGDVHDFQKEEDERRKKVLSALVGKIKEQL